MSRRAQRVNYDANLQTIPEVPLLERTFFNITENLIQQGVSLEAINQLTPLKVRVSNKNKPSERTHILLSVEDKDSEGGLFKDIVWYSPATYSDPVKPKTIALKPGLGEIVERGIGYEFHEEIATLNLFDNVLTHATEGYGPEASPISLVELPDYNLDRMAHRLQRLINTYCPNHVISLVGTSMGTVVCHKLQKANLGAKPEDQIDIVAVVNYVPALVSRENILMNMVALFPVMMALDGGLELGLRTHPKRSLQVFRSLIESRPGWKDIPLLGRLALDLTKGVDKEDVFTNTQATSTATVTGSLDPLKEVPMWQASDADLYVIRNRGHGMALKPVLGARKITSTLSTLR